MTKVVPIAATKVEWKAYIEACQDALGKSPTRALDRANRKPTEMLSFPLTLPLPENIDPASLQSDSSLHHMSVSFIVTTNRVIPNLQNWVTVHLFGMPYTPYNESVVTVMTGTLYQWRESVYHVLTSRPTDPQVIDIFTQIKYCFNQANQIWAGKWRIN